MFSQIDPGCNRSELSNVSWDGAVRVGMHGPWREIRDLRSQVPSVGARLSHEGQSDRGDDIPASAELSPLNQVVQPIGLESCGVAISPQYRWQPLHEKFSQRPLRNSVQWNHLPRKRDIRCRRCGQQ